MTELLFVLTTIFVAYVVYVIIQEQQQISKKPIDSTGKLPEKPVVEELPQQQQEAVSETKAPAAPVITNRETPPVTNGKNNVRNPLTGETTSLSNNYRFTKRWVKEALVSEGLLEKIYKNTELDTSTEASIREAMAKLATIDKYRG